MTARSILRSGDSPRSSARVQAVTFSPAVVLAVALPIVFLHIRYQPSFTVDVGPSATVALSDVAVMAVALAALWAGLRDGFGVLRGASAIWISSAAFLIFALARARTGTHLVGALKFAEYAALAPALPLLVRGAQALRLLSWTVALWSAVASFAGLLQFFGVAILGPWAAGRRQPSFLGQLDFAALSGMAFALALAGLALGPRRVGGARLVGIAAVAGVLGLALSASVAALAGIAAATALAAAIGARRRTMTPRRLATLAAAAGLVAAGVLVMRGGDLAQFTRFLGIAKQQPSSSADVQTYAQRTILVDMGWRIFRAHPAAGAGWQASNDPAVFEPVLPAVRAAYPNAAPLSFPSREHPWGIQNAYVQALADLGAVGFALLVALLAAGLWASVRGALRSEAAAIAVIAGGWLLVAMGVWAGLGLVSGVPADATFWLALGLAVAAPTLARPTLAPHRLPAARRKSADAR